MKVRRSVAALILVAAVASMGCNSIRVRTTLNKGNDLYKAERYDEAIVEYDKVLKIAPNDWQANYLKSVSYLALYKPGSTHAKDLEYSEKGIASFENLLKLPPPTPEDADKVRGFYLSFLTSAERTDKALEFMKGQLEKNPNDAALISQIADMHLKGGDFVSALGYLEKRAALEPDSKVAWYTIGVSCWARSYHGGVMVSPDERRDVIEKGIAALDKALAIDPEYFDALSYINLLYREKGKYLATVQQNMEAGEAFLKADEYQKKALQLKSPTPPDKPKA